VASNRRYLTSDGTVSYGRYSGGSHLAGRVAGVGTIDPMLKTLSFWNGETALCALSLYATHPMSYYRTGRISADILEESRRAVKKRGTLIRWYMATFLESALSRARTSPRGLFPV